MGYPIQYYDLVLGAIIGSVLAGAAVGALTPVALPVALIVLGGLGLLFVGHALFVNGPVDDVADLTDRVENGPGPVDPTDVPLLE